MIKLYFYQDCAIVYKDGLRITFETRVHDTLYNTLQDLLEKDDNYGTFDTHGVNISKIKGSYYLYNLDGVLMKLYPDEFAFLVSNLRVGGQYHETSSGNQITCDYLLTINHIGSDCIKILMCDDLRHLFFKIKKLHSEYTDKKCTDNGTYKVYQNHDIRIQYKDLEINILDYVRISNGNNSIRLKVEDIDTILTMM
jgi:hypothetical protein